MTQQKSNNMATISSTLYNKVFSIKNLSAFLKESLDYYIDDLGYEKALEGAEIVPDIEYTLIKDLGDDFLGFLIDTYLELMSELYKNFGESLDTHDDVLIGHYLKVINYLKSKPGVIEKTYTIN